MASQTPDGQTAALNEEIQAALSRTGRNPYEMRFDLLHLAKDILETNAHMAREDKSKDRPVLLHHRTGDLDSEGTQRLHLQQVGTDASQWTIHHDGGGIG